MIQLIIRNIELLNIQDYYTLLSELHASTTVSLLFFIKNQLSVIHNIIPDNIIIEMRINVLLEYG